MGRKKRDMSYLRPFCYYCDKTFINEIILHQHQKAKHFTCPKCQKKFSTADSLKSHLTTAHRETLAKIPNALQGRDSTELKIFGMQNVPKQTLDEKTLVGAAQFWNKFFSDKNKKDKTTKTAREKKEIVRQDLNAKKALQAVQKKQEQLTQQQKQILPDKKALQDQQLEHYFASQENKPIQISLNFRGNTQQKQTTDTKQSAFGED